MSEITYRQTRNIERSLKDYIVEILEDNNWSNINVVKTFDKVYDLPFDADKKTAAISIRVSYTNHDPAEVGSNSTIRKPLILIDVFGSSDGQKEDIVDTLSSELKNGFTYYEYVLENGSVKTKTSNGKIEVNTMSQTPINLDSEKDQLNVWDRYRMLITLNCTKNNIEE